jgi:hypothetical protein
MKRNNVLVQGFALGVVCYLLFAACGCGYTTHSMITDKYRTIYVEPFVNKIPIAQGAETTNKYMVYRPALESEITQSVIDKFLADGNFKPAKLESADLALSGELVEFRRDPLRYTDNDDVEEYRICIIVNLTLKDNKENKVLWQENRFTGDESYFTMGNFAQSEDTAVNLALSDLSRRIVERAVEQW